MFNLKKELLSICCILVIFLLGGCSSTGIFLIKDQSREKIVSAEKQTSEIDIGSERSEAKTRFKNIKVNPGDNSGKIFENVFDQLRNNFRLPDLPVKRVNQQVKVFTRNREYLNRMFERSKKYLYFIHDEVRRRNLPSEIALLPFVESAYNPHATSRAKAAGLWQFIPSTGRRYGLNQTWWVDDRRTVVESTHAALDYL